MNEARNVRRAASPWPSLGFGVGLRAEHFPDVESGPPRVDWLEALTENHIASGGRPLAILERARRDVPLALHGVSLSIGSTDPLDRGYLRRLKELVDRVEPAIVSDHLCWSGVDGRPLHDLLPLPGTEEVLRHVARRVAIVQDFLGRRIALENPSAYFAWRHSRLAEHELLAGVADEADCGILLDVNNLHVSSRNLGFDPIAYLDAIPAARVAYVHLAGFTDTGSYLFDTHSAPVHVDVWRLYARAVERLGPVSTLVEWDAGLPSWNRLVAEAERARTVSRNVHESHRTVAARPARAAALDAIADRPSRAA